MPRPSDTQQEEIPEDGFTMQSEGRPDLLKQGLRIFEQDNVKRRSSLSGNEPEIWESITNELTKSYGFRRDSASGQWSWSMDNIGKAFKEDPFWTTLDWASLAVSPLKFATAAVGVAKGAKAAGVIGKAYKAGEFAGQSAKTFRGKVAQQFISPELAAAAERKLAAPSRLFSVRIPGTERRLNLASAAATQIDDDYLRWVDKYGGEIWENKAIIKVQEREKLIQQAMFARKGQDLIQGWNKSGMPKEQQAEAMKLLEKGIAPGDSGAAELFASNPAAMEAYKNTWDFRNTIHEESYRLGLISEDTYKANLKTYSPRIYKEWEKVKGALNELNPKASTIPGDHVAGKALAEEGIDPATKIVKGGAGRYQKRAKDEIESLTRIWDPAATVANLAEAGQVIAKQRYAQGLSQSVIARTSQQVGQRVVEIIQNNDLKLAAVHGLTEAKIDAARRLVDGMTDINRDARYEALAELLEWKKIDDLYDGDTMPHYLKNLPEEFRDKWLDPAAAEDIKGTLQVMGQPRQLLDFYKKTVNLFKASKTAYNPGTHVRNMLGATVFHHLATGGVPFSIPLKGLKAFREGGQVYKEAVEAGIIGSTFSSEIRQALQGAESIKAGSAIDWIGSGPLRDLAKGGAGKLEEFYRGTDEVFKLDAWLKLTKKYTKLGHAPDLAKAMAKRDVDKFMPNFTVNSQVAGVLGEAIPFASFTTEALRVWKNVLSEKPHLAFFYNHLTESMSQTFGAMAGFSSSQVQEAQDTLPNYMKGKKTLLLPFNIEGKPQFLDLSYVIPLGNIVEAQDSERFFLTEFIDPTTNPVVNLAAAATTGKDPFSGRDIGPNFTERQLGVPVENKAARITIGVAEHMLQMFVPPWAPPGYAGTNILEAARGQKDPRTMEPLEDGVFKTVLANITSFRTYSPDVNTQVKNVQEEKRKIGEKLSTTWKRWEFARANGDVKAMEAEKERIISLKLTEGDDNPDDYFAKAIQSRGPFNNLSSKQMEEILRRAESLGGLSPKDQRLRAELLVRYQQRRTGSGRRAK